MKLKGKLLKWLSIPACVLVVQTLTFYLIADRQLEAKLLPEYFQFSHHSDSAYVRDFYGPAEDPPLIPVLSHNLKDDQEGLKEKLSVRFIYFAKPSREELFNEKDFNLVYHTWIERGDWISLSNFYKMRQTERIIIDKKRIYKREAVYQWCLFFWIKCFEFIQSDHLQTLD